MRYLLVLSAALLISSFSSAQIADQQIDAHDVYQRMLKSAQHYNYKGSLTYTKNGFMEAYTVDSRIDGTNLVQHLSTLNGKQAELTANYASACQNQENTHEGLNDAYNFFVQGKTRVAGRSGTIIYLFPSDKYRYGYIFVADDETGVMLASRILNSQRQSMEQMEFVSIELTAKELRQVSESIDAIESTENKEADQQEIQQALATSTETYAVPESVYQVSCSQLILSNGWQLSWLPTGFKLLSSEIDQENTRMVYTDGLTNISVFIDKVAEADVAPVTLRRGATTFYLGYAKHNEQQYLVSFVGEVPFDTVKRLFGALELI